MLCLLVVLCVPLHSTTEYWIGSSFHTWSLSYRSTSSSCGCQQPPRSFSTEEGKSSSAKERPTTVDSVGPSTSTYSYMHIYNIYSIYTIVYIQHIYFGGRLYSRDFFVHLIFCGWAKFFHITTLLCR